MPLDFTPAGTSAASDGSAEAAFTEELPGAALPDAPEPDELLLQAVTSRVLAARAAPAAMRRVRRVRAVMGESPPEGESGGARRRGEASTTLRRGGLL
ncbi:hypothetical protein GCM10010440_67650 [Kitasatospora cinereorecta]